MFHFLSIALLFYIWKILIVISVNALNETCEAGGYITHLNWNNINNDVPVIYHKIEYDIDLLSITFDLELPYLGSSYLSTNDSILLGTTYMIDFVGLSSSDNIEIEKPGNCQNRLSSDFKSDIVFKEFWKYSDTPNINGHLGSRQYLAYPPPSLYWNLSFTNCSYINYYGTFSWFDLMECSDYDQINNYNHIIFDNDWINLTGTLFVDIISPNNLENDDGIYQLYQALNIPFTFSLKNWINSNLFILSIIDVFMSNDDDDDDIMEIILLTESLNHLTISSPFMLISPFVTDLKSDIWIDQYSINKTNTKIGCQLWKISVLLYDINNSSSYIDLSGIYGFRFDINTNDEYIALTTNIDYIHYIDNKNINNFELIEIKELEKEYDINNNTVYLEIEIVSLSSISEISNIEIENVWLCSELINLECLYSDDVIHIIKHDEINSPSFINKNNIIRFFFNINDIINADLDLLYIHTQLNIKFNNNQYSIFKHYISNITLNNVNNNNDSSSTSILDSFSLKQLIAIVLGENVLCFFLCCFMILFWRKFREKRLKKEKKARRTKRHLARAKTLSSMNIPTMNIPTQPIESNNNNNNNNNNDNIRTRSRSHTPTTTHSILKGKSNNNDISNNDNSSDIPSDNPFITRAQTFSHGSSIQHYGGIQLTQRRISLSSLQQLQKQLQQQQQQQQRSRDRGESNSSLPHSQLEGPSSSNSSYKS